MQEKQTRLCVICGKELAHNQSLYCSQECRAEAARRRNRARYLALKKENSKEFQEYVARNNISALERYYINRDNRYSKYAEEILSMNTLDEVRNFLMNNFRFKNHGK